MSAPLSCLGALALETATPPQRLGLPREDAAALAQHVADDLQRLLPGVAALDLVLGALHFDPAELLRPGWPAHAALDALAARAPGPDAGRVIAFGLAGAQAPVAALAPDPQLQGGALRLLPFLLRGAPDAVAALGRAMEATLLETGMAGAATALFCQDAFATRLEHARYLTLHDLAAMMALQYEHAGLAPLWPLLEGALFGAGGEEWLDAPREPLLCVAQGEARFADPDLAAWRAAQDAALDDAAAAAGYRAFRGRLAQFAAVLGAHGLHVQRVPLRPGEDARAALRRG